MKQTITSILILALTFTACSTTEQGAVNGASFGAMFGSAIGGIIGGPRGHDIGTMVGMVAGGAAGATIGHQNEKQTYEKYQKRKAERTVTVNERKSPSTQSDVPVVEGNESPLTLRNLRFIGEDGNQAINRGETCQIVFELANLSEETVYDVVPYVSEMNGNDHLRISPTTRIESINHGDAIRYTATVKADNHLKEGTACFRIAVSTEAQEFVTLKEFSIATEKKP